VCVCVIFLVSFSVCYLFICISLQFGGIKVEIKILFSLDARSVVLKIEEDYVDTVTNCVKRFFRELIDPLLTKNLYRHWIWTASEADHNTKLFRYKNFLNSLPEINYLTLKFFVAHLKR